MSPGIQLGDTLPQLLQKQLPLRQILVVEIHDFQFTVGGGPQLGRQIAHLMGRMK